MLNVIDDSSYLSITPFSCWMEIWPTSYWHMQTQFWHERGLCFHHPRVNKTWNLPGICHALCCQGQFSFQLLRKNITYNLCVYKGFETEALPLPCWACVDTGTQNSRAASEGPEKEVDGFPVEGNRDAESWNRETFWSPLKHFLVFRGKTCTDGAKLDY